jgi:tetratricopeptide (TPR) repeat protein
VNVLKTKPLMLLFYALVPIIVIIILFKIDTIVGLIGIVTFLLLIIVVNRNLIYRLKAQLEYGKGNLDNSIKWFANAKKVKADVLVNYGFVLLKSGKLDESEQVLTKAMDKSSSSEEKNFAKSNLALVVWRKGDLDKAIEMLKEVILEYKNTAVYGSLGYLLIEKGDLDEALKVNLEAYEYNSDNAIIQDNLAHLYHLRGEMDKADNLFEKLMKKEPHFPEAYYDYALYLEDIGKVEEAKEMYNKSLSCSFNFNNTITKEQVQKALDNLNKLNTNEKPHD